MYKIIGSLLFVLVISAGSAFTTIKHPPVKTSQQNAPEVMLTIDLSQTAPGTALGTWTSTQPGPYRVSLGNLKTNTRVEFMVAGTSMVFTNLDIKTTYRLSVWDGDNFISDDELITF